MRAWMATGLLVWVVVSCVTSVAIGTWLTGISERVARPAGHDGRDQPEQPPAAA